MYVRRLANAACLLVCVAWLASCGGGGGSAAPVEPVDERLNIVLITADDLGRTLGSYGDRFARTPHIDSLAERGVLFENAYVTQASCSSSRSSILTGLYPSQNGQLGLASGLPEYRLHAGIATMPGLLQQAGYFTGILGKMHVASSEPFAFDVSWAEANAATMTRDVVQVRDKAEQFLAQAQDRPFFLYVNFFDPHRELDAEANQVKGLPANLVTGANVEPFPYLGMDGPDLREEIAIYYNTVSRLDTGVGLLLELLQGKQMLDNTLVIFVGDNGVPFSRAKTTSYEAGVAVPMIIVWPGVGTAGLRSRALVSTVDLLPTLLDAIGADPIPTSGHSLRDVMWDNAAVDWRTRLFTEYNSHGIGQFYPRRTVRNDRFKLIHNLESPRRNPTVYQGKARPGPGIVVDPAALKAYETLASPPEWELYDLATDPHERINLASDERYQQTLGELQGALMQWREAHGDPLLSPAEVERLRRIDGVGAQ